jgi:hypothetical protein
MGQEHVPVRLARGLQYKTTGCAQSERRDRGIILSKSWSVVVPHDMEDYVVVAGITMMPMEIPVRASDVKLDIPGQEASTWVRQESVLVVGPTSVRGHASVHHTHA